uniref:Uncharacterized protein n=1 Tax=Myotis myotis TaxID=51298 RepID=A0A7J7Z4Z6_MYOMY|nr:hypothetical protein mMyoMyo1_010659 [Myotis myotis]
MMRLAGSTGCSSNIWRLHWPICLISISSGGSEFSHYHSQLGNRMQLPSFWVDSRASRQPPGREGGEGAAQVGRRMFLPPQDSAWVEGPGQEPDIEQSPALGQLDSRLSKFCLLNNCILQLNAHKSLVTARLRVK